MQELEEKLDETAKFADEDQLLVTPKGERPEDTADSQ